MKLHPQWLPGHLPGRLILSLFLSAFACQGHPEWEVLLKCLSDIFTYLEHFRNRILDGPALVNDVFFWGALALPFRFKSSGILSASKLNVSGYGSQNWRTREENRMTGTPVNSWLYIYIHKIICTYYIHYIYIYIHYMPMNYGILCLLSWLVYVHVSARFSDHRARSDRGRARWYLSSSSVVFLDADFV